MRKNFAEFSQEGGTKHFILYDAPATVRTDADSSSGNFFPFNKGSEVFTGLNANRTLTSSVACSCNTMNHHLGMTVDVEIAVCRDLTERKRASYSPRSSSLYVGVGFRGADPAGYERVELPQTEAFALPLFRQYLSG